MSKGLLILADGFEDTEALTTLDVLRRSKLDVTPVTLYNNTVLTQSGNTIIVDKLLKDIKKEEYDFLIIPGGKAVFNVLNKEPLIDKTIKYFYESKKLICAICAAPMLIAKLGYFKDLDFTVFPNCIDFNYLGNNTEKELVVTDNIITARSMYYSIDFSLAIIEKLQGKAQKERVKCQLMGLK